MTTSPKLIINIDPALKESMQQIAVAYGYGTISGYVRNIVIEDINRKRQINPSAVNTLLSKLQGNAATSDDSAAMKLALKGQRWARRAK